MEKELPKKTCTIDKLITKSEDIDKVLNKEKTVSRRAGRYADIGETIELRGRTFRIKNVYPQVLRDMTDRHAQDEGYANMEEYKKHLKNIHPFTRMLPFTPWMPSKEVWVHEFEEMTAQNG